MAGRRPPRTPLLLLSKALFRYQIVSAVKASVLSGQGTDAAVRAVAAQTHLTPADESTTVSVRSIYRWLAEQDRDEPADPEAAQPAHAIDGDCFPGETDEATAARVLAHACDQLGEILNDYRCSVLARLARERSAWPF